MPTNILDILKDKTFHDILNDIEHVSEDPTTKQDNASGLTDSVTVLTNLANSIENPEFIIPIVGVQGSGKSTILNALCFDDPILPIDSNETTSVPLEIRRTPQAEEPKALIFFKDGNKLKVPLSQEELGKYTHQDNNPGNKLGVLKAVVESSADFLNNGLVLVDIPGFGSLTKENQKTSNDFAFAASGIICVIRTVPTLTATDASTIKPFWKLKRNNMYFIESVWDDESKNETQEGLDFNRNVLSDIAKKEIFFSSAADGAEAKDHLEVTIIPINGYRALKDRLTGSPETGWEKGSGAKELHALFNRLSANWPLELASNAKTTALDCAQKALYALESRQQPLLQDKELAKKTIQDEYDKLKAGEESLKNFNNKTLASLKIFQSMARTKCDSWASNEGGNLRTKMRELSLNGVTDGDRLNKAFNDYSKESFAILSEVIQDLIDKFIDSLQDDFNEFLKETKLNKKFDNNFMSNVSQIMGEEGVKFREFAAPIGGVVGAVGGAILANAAFGSIFGPPGIILGAVCGLFGALFGGGTKESLEEKQISQINAQIPIIVNTFTSNSTKNIIDSVKKFAAEIKTKLQNCYETAKCKNELEYKLKMDELYKTDEEKSEALKVIQTKISTINNIIESINSLAI
jgi:hypothetical protein